MTDPSLSGSGDFFLGKHASPLRSCELCICTSLPIPDKLAPDQRSENALSHAEAACKQAEQVLEVRPRMHTTLQQPGLGTCNALRAVGSLKTTHDALHRVAHRLGPAYAAGSSMSRRPNGRCARLTSLAR
jgi:hypothetical protein